MGTYAKPNDVTYGLMFKAVGRLLRKREDRDRYAKTLFKLCSNDGQLGPMAFIRLKGAVSEDMFLELTKGSQSYEEIPLEWRCNVEIHRKKFAKRKNKKKLKK